MHSELRWLRRFDPFCSAFGASVHRYRLNPPLSEGELAAFEERHACRLPADYRAFLRTWGNGGAGPYYGVYPLAEAPIYGDLAKPFPLVAAWNEALPFDVDVPAELRDGCLGLSDIGCGYWVFLVVTGPQRGFVWEDYSAAAEGITPTGMTFHEWYHGWLSHRMRRIFPWRR